MALFRKKSPKRVSGGTHTYEGKLPHPGRYEYTLTIQPDGGGAPQEFKEELFWTGSSPRTAVAKAVRTGTKVTKAAARPIPAAEIAAGGTTRVELKYFNSGNWDATVSFYSTKNGKPDKAHVTGSTSDSDAFDVPTAISPCLVQVTYEKDGVTILEAWSSQPLPLDGSPLPVEHFAPSQLRIPLVKEGSSEPIHPSSRYKALIHLGGDLVDSSLVHYEEKYITLKDPAKKYALDRLEVTLLLPNATDSSNPLIESGPIDLSDQANLMLKIKEEPRMFMLDDKNNKSKTYDITNISYNVYARKHEGGRIVDEGPAQHVAEVGTLHLLPGLYRVEILQNGSKIHEKPVSVPLGEERIYVPIIEGGVHKFVEDLESLEINNTSDYKKIHDALLTEDLRAAVRLHQKFIERKEVDTLLAKLDNIQGHLQYHPDGSHIVGSTIHKLFGIKENLDTHRAQVLRKDLVENIIPTLQSMIKTGLEQHTPSRSVLKLGVGRKRPPKGGEYEKFQRAEKELNNILKTEDNNYDTFIKALDALIEDKTLEELTTILNNNKKPHDKLKQFIEKLETNLQRNSNHLKIIQDKHASIIERFLTIERMLDIDESSSHFNNHLGNLDNSEKNRATAGRWVPGVVAGQKAAEAAARGEAVSMVDMPGTDEGEA